MIFTSDSVSVIAPLSLSSTCALFLALICWIAVFNTLLALSDGSSVIVMSRPPGVGVKSIFCPVLGSKLKPCRCGQKQTNLPQSVLSMTAINGRLQLTVRLSMAIGFPDASSVDTILFPWSYTFSLRAVLKAHPSRESLWTRYPRAAGWFTGTTVLHAAVSMPNVTVL